MESFQPQSANPSCPGRKRGDRGQGEGEAQGSTDVGAVECCVEGVRNLGFFSEGAGMMMSASSPREDKYIKARKDRQGYVDAVLRSPARKKIVVAGPGTGKTFLFSRILEGKVNTLTLTFINSLV